MTPQQRLQRQAVRLQAACADMRSLRENLTLAMTAEGDPAIEGIQDDIDIVIHKLALAQKAVFAMLDAMEHAT